ncbi:MAG: radical SAM protein, partial [Flavihumibacter sp.]
DTPGTGAFANNDRVHSDPTGADHAQFAYGLKKSLLNYMHGACLDYPLHRWFESKTPRTSVAPDFIAKAIAEEEPVASKANQKIIWLGVDPTLLVTTKSKKGQQWEVAELVFEGLSNSTRIRIAPAAGKWLKDILPLLRPGLPKPMTRAALMKRYEDAGLSDFELFWDNKPVNTLYTVGLLQV